MRIKDLKRNIGSGDISSGNVVKFDNGFFLVTTAIDCENVLIVNLETGSSQHLNRSLCVELVNCELVVNRYL